MWLTGLAALGVWDLPRSGTEPVSPALADEFFTAEPPDLGIEPVSPASPPLQANSLPWSHRGSPREALRSHFVVEELLELRVKSRLTALLYPCHLTPAEYW